MFHHGAGWQFYLLNGNLYPVMTTPRYFEDQMALSARTNAFPILPGIFQNHIQPITMHSNGQVPNHIQPITMHANGRVQNHGGAIHFPAQNIGSQFQMPPMQRIPVYNVQNYGRMGHFPVQNIGPQFQTPPMQRVPVLHRQYYGGMGQVQASKFQMPPMQPVPVFNLQNYGGMGQVQALNIGPQFQMPPMQRVPVFNSQNYCGMGQAQTPNAGSQFSPPMQRAPVFNGQNNSSSGSSSCRYSPNFLMMQNSLQSAAQLGLNEPHGENSQINNQPPVTPTPTPPQVGILDTDDIVSQNNQQQSSSSNASVLSSGSSFTTNSDIGDQVILNRTVGGGRNNAQKQEFGNIAYGDRQRIAEIPLPPDQNVSPWSSMSAGSSLPPNHVSPGSSYYNNDFNGSNYDNMQGNIAYGDRHRIAEIPLPPDSNMSPGPSYYNNDHKSNYDYLQEFSNVAYGGAENPLPSDLNVSPWSYYSENVNLMFNRNGMVNLNGQMFNRNGMVFANQMEYSGTPNDKNNNNRRYPNVRSKFCKFCFNSGRRNYRSHWMKSRKNRISCRYLRRIKCKICLATGNNAHTKKFCPMLNILTNHQEEVQVQPSVQEEMENDQNGPTNSNIRELFNFESRSKWTQCFNCKNWSLQRKTISRSQLSTHHKKY